MDVHIFWHRLEVTMPEYIVVNRDLGVDVESTSSEVCIEVANGFALPVLIRGDERFAELSKVLLNCLPTLDETMFAELQRRSQGHPTITNAVYPPDPWLLAVAYIMWEGVLQGLSWDTLKALVNRAINKMQALGVAPQHAGQMRTERGLRFSWSGQLKVANLSN